MILHNVNPSKLMHEFNENGITPNMQSTLKLGENIAESVTITFADGTNMELAQSIIDAHDTTPIPATPTPKERIEQLENIILMMMEVM